MDPYESMLGVKVRGVERAGSIEEDAGVGGRERRV
jgi:hypothetical protein